MNDEPWRINDVREGSGGVYYTLSPRTRGTMEAGVTVKWTRHNTAACLTCMTTSCTHARWVTTYRKQHQDTAA